MMAATDRELAALVMAPVSPAMAKLLHQVQAQIIRESEDRHLAKGCVILQPLDLAGEHAHTRSWEANGMRIFSAHGQRGDVVLRTWYVADPAYPNMRPGVWTGTEERRDENGRRWQSYFPHHFVQDDFGTLVPVGGVL